MAKKSNKGNPITMPNITHEITIVFSDCIIGLVLLDDLYYTSEQGFAYAYRRFLERFVELFRVVFPFYKEDYHVGNTTFYTKLKFYESSLMVILNNHIDFVGLGFNIYKNGYLYEQIRSGLSEFDSITVKDSLVQFLENCRSI